MKTKFKYDKDAQTYIDKTEFVIVDKGNGKFTVEEKKGHFGTTLIKSKPKSLLKKILGK